MEGICIDVTDSRANEQQLRKEEERLAEAQEVAHLGNWELDLRTNELHWSDEIYRIFEIEKENFAANYEAFVECIHPEDRDSVNSAYLSSLRNKKQYAITHRLRMKDGRIKYVHERCRTQFDKEGNPLISFGTVLDITDNKMAEIEKTKLQQKLYQSQKMDAVGQLAGGIAHDFNNMLGVILGQTEELLSRIDSRDENYDSVQEIKKAAERSAGLTRQLLAFSRQETISPRYFDLNEAIEGMLKMLKRLIGENITVTWEPSQESAPIFMDPGQVDQILANLCVNARDAITTSGTIGIKTATVEVTSKFIKRFPQMKEGEYICLTVSDTGSGIESAVQEKVFEPFFTTKEVGKGTGLGLSTVYGIMQQNNGVITIIDSSENGTVMALYFPQKICELPAQEFKEHTHISLNGTARILLVEDEEMLLQTVKKVLTRHGYEVIGVNSPNEALKYIEECEQIDLLITDIIMPELNGRQLAARILSKQKNLTVLYMSGYTSSVITDHGVLEEGVAFLQKPFRFNELLHKIKELL